MTLGNMRELGVHPFINVTVAADSITRAWLHPALLIRP
jgi:hypothetical protein